MGGFSGHSGLRPLLDNFAQLGAVKGQFEYMEVTSESFWSVYKKHVFLLIDFNEFVQL